MFFDDSTVCGRFRSGVSLHSHTLHSREYLSFINEFARKSILVRMGLRCGERIYRLRKGNLPNLYSTYWTPPLGPSERGNSSLIRSPDLAWLRSFP